jgi:hypothetical protein
VACPRTCRHESHRACYQEKGKTKFAHLHASASTYQPWNHWNVHSMHVLMPEKSELSQGSQRSRVCSQKQRPAAITQLIVPGWQMQSPTPSRAGNARGRQATRQISRKAHAVGVACAWTHRGGLIALQEAQACAHAAARDPTLRSCDRHTGHAGWCSRPY